MWSQLFKKAFEVAGDKMGEKGGGMPSVFSQGGVQNLGMGAQDIGEGAQFQAQAPQQAMPQPNFAQPSMGFNPQQPMMQQPMQSPMAMAQQDAATIQQNPKMSMWDKYKENKDNQWDDKVSMWNDSTGLMDFAQKNRAYNDKYGITPYQAPQSMLMAQDPSQMMPYHNYGGGY